MRAQPGWRRLTLLAAAVVLLPAPAAAQGGYTGSVYVVTVDTPEGDRSDAVFLLNSVDVERGIIRATATLPFLIERSAWTDPELGPVESAWQSGLADPIFRVEVDAWRAPARTAALKLSASVKVPVASVDEGFSSGKADYAIGASWSTFRGRQSVLVDFTYWIPGEPSDTDYRNAASFYVGYGRVLDRRYRWSFIVSTSGGPSVIPGAAATAQLSTGVLRAFGTRASLGVTLDVGLTESAADFAVGTMWRVAF